MRAETKYANQHAPDYLQQQGKRKQPTLSTKTCKYMEQPLWDQEGNMTARQKRTKRNSQPATISSQKAGGVIQPTSRAAADIPYCRSMSLAAWSFTCALFLTVYTSAQLSHTRQRSVTPRMHVFIFFEVSGNDRGASVDFRGCCHRLSWKYTVFTASVTVHSTSTANITHRWPDPPHCPM